MPLYDNVTIEHAAKLGLRPCLAKTPHRLDAGQAPARPVAALPRATHPHGPAAR